MSRSPPALPDELRERFAVQRVLGRGGMGVVYQAMDRALDRPVALKCISLAPHPDLTARFLREARTLSRLKHHGVVQVYEVGDVDGQPYLVLEYVEGTPLDRLCPLPEPRPVLMQLAEALGAVHEIGVLHRDVKPGNVLLEAGGRVVLLDFGLVTAPDGAALTRTGLVPGTPIFLAPELIVGEAASPASDWFSFGATAFTLAEGRVPFELSELVALSEGCAVPLRFERLDAEDPLAVTIRRCLRCDPSGRLQEASEVRRLLERGTREGPPPSTALGSATDSALLPSPEGGGAGGPRRDAASGNPPAHGRPLFPLGLVTGMSLAVLLAALGAPPAPHPPPRALPPPSGAQPASPLAQPRSPPAASLARAQAAWARCDRLVREARSSGIPPAGLPAEAWEALRPMPALAVLREPEEEQRRGLGYLLPGAYRHAWNRPALRQFLRPVSEALLEFHRRAAAQASSPEEAARREAIRLVHEALRTLRVAYVSELLDLPSDSFAAGDATDAVSAYVRFLLHDRIASLQRAMGIPSTDHQRAMLRSVLRILAAPEDHEALTLELVSQAWRTALDSALDEDPDHFLQLLEDAGPSVRVLPTRTRVVLLAAVRELSSEHPRARAHPQVERRAATFPG